MKTINEDRKICMLVTAARGEGRFSFENGMKTKHQKDSSPLDNTSVGFGLS